MTCLDARWALTWVSACAEAMAAHRTALNDLDRAIGDGDHGQNMHRGFTAVLTRLQGSTTPTPGAVLRVVASGLMSGVGGAAGPLYGTAFLRAATTAGAEQLDATRLAQMLTAATDGIAARGQARPGDKTMVDAWQPAADAAAKAAAQGQDVVAVLQAAARAAAAGAQATEPWIARKGRASYLGERARGHRDPGAQSTALLLAAAAQSASRSDPAPPHSGPDAGKDGDG